MATTVLLDGTVGPRVNTGRGLLHGPVAERRASCGSAGRDCRRVRRSGRAGAVRDGYTFSLQGVSPPRTPLLGRRVKASGTRWCVHRTVPQRGVRRRRRARDVHRPRQIGRPMVGQAARHTRGARLGDRVAGLDPVEESAVVRQVPPRRGEAEPQMTGVEPSEAQQQGGIHAADDGTYSTYRQERTLCTHPAESQGFTRNRGINTTVEAHDFERIVRERLAEIGETAIGAASRAGLPRDAIRSVLRGHPPNLLRAKKICEALGLSLSVGLPRNTPRLGEGRPDDAERRTKGLPPDLERHTQGLVRAVAEAGGDPIPPEMRATLGHRPLTGRDVGGAAASPIVETEPTSVVIPFAADVRFAAESGEAVWDETAEMAVSVARSALAPWAHPQRLRCARVVGDSMAPTIRDGDLVVLDSGRAEPLDGQVFGVRTDEGLVVKRVRDVDGRWHLDSDNAGHEPQPVTGGEQIVGQVAWSGPPIPDHRAGRVFDLTADASVRNAVGAVGDRGTEIARSDAVGGSTSKPSNKPSAAGRSTPPRGRWGR